MDNIKRFENPPIRTAWDEEKEEWFFSVSDVVEILSESKDVKQYIKKMRSRDAELNTKWGTICTPCSDDDGRRQKQKNQRCRYRGNPPHYPVDPLKKSGAVQDVVGSGRQRTNRRNN